MWMEKEGFGVQKHVCAEGSVEGQIWEEVMMRRTVVLLCKQSKRKRNRWRTKPNNLMTITVMRTAERGDGAGRYHLQSV